MLPDNFLGIPTRRRRQLVHRTFFVLMHLAVVPAFWMTPSWMDLVLFLALVVITGLGITVGYHRLLAHNAFDCPRWVRWMLAVLGLMALMGRPQAWVGLHRQHHLTPDVPGQDPHTPRDGFFHAHMGWIWKGFESLADRHRHLARDMESDPVLRVLENEHTESVPWLLLAGACWASGGWSGVYWGAIVRTVVVWQLTWSINTLCHRFGYQAYPCNDTSTNLWWMALLTLGEGWHNNHHVYGDAAYIGHTKWQVDGGGYFIWLLEKTGLAWDVIRPDTAEYKGL